jgi:diguanylate cyclase (GGDEF)-like protein
MSDQNSEIERLQKRLARAKKARLEAEEILSEKSAELYKQSLDTEESKKLLQMALWASGESIWSWHKDTDSFYFKDFVHDSSDIVDRKVSFDEFVQQVHPNDIENFKLNWTLHKMGFSTDVDGAYRLKQDESYEWICFRGRVVVFDEDAAQKIVGTLKNVTGLVEAETSSKLMSYAFSQSTDPMLIISKSLQIIEINEAFSRLADITPKISQHFSLSKFVKFSHSELQELYKNETLSLETTLSLGDTLNIDVDLSISEFKSEDSISDYYVVALKDLTERKKTEKKLYQLAHFDPLTNLLNRTAFKEKFEGILSSNEYLRFAVVFVDIQGVKEINDTLGHESGEKVLKLQSEVLKKLTSPNMHLCRWGDDEFCFILPILNDDTWEQKGLAIIDALKQQSITVNGH